MFSLKDSSIFVKKLIPLKALSLQELNLYHEISWPNGAPPVDEPPCGFEGERCVNEFGK